jgi:malate synthase
MCRIEVKGSQGERFDEILTADALEFVARLHREFDSTRRELLVARMDCQKELDRGGTLDFLSDTREVREGNCKIVPGPDALQDRRVEITGPTSRKMVINALNSGGRGSWPTSRTPTRRCCAT